MTEEKGKLDIEDIKDPEDEELDIDKAVSEEAPEETEEPVEEQEPTKETETVLDEPAKGVEETPAPETKKIKKPKKGWVKYAVIGVTVALVGAAAALGYMYYLQQKNKAAEVADTNTENQRTEEPEATEEPTAPTDYLYINSEVGLNLRQEPNTKAAVLAIIPYGTKITVLEKQTGWVKTTYEEKTGWVSADFAQPTDPLIYQDTTYGFGLTFKSDWAGYKFIEYQHLGSTTVKTYYVCLPTTDKVWDETASGIPKGYASLFVMGIYTKAEWAKLAGGEMLPAKLGESDKYVYTYLPGQAYATDLKTQYGEISTIIKTFEVLK